MVGMFVIIPLLNSCENDLESVKVVTATDDTPDQIITDLHMLESDSGIVRFEIIASRVEIYTTTDKKQIFKDGFVVNFYKSKDVIEARLEAEYAELREMENLFLARNNVIFTNYIEEQTLKTEELYWDQNMRRIRTDKAYEIIGKDTYARGYGMDADETFSTYNTSNFSGKHD